MDILELNYLDIDENDSYKEIIKYYRRKLVDYGVIREIKNSCKSQGRYNGKIIKEDKVVA